MLALKCRHLSLLCLLFPVSPAPAQNISKAQFKHAPQRAKRTIGNRSQEVVRALSKLDMTTLSRYVHPRQGLAFYPYLAGDKPQKRTRQQVRGFLRDGKTYVWGSYDGTGNPIKLTNRLTFASSSTMIIFHRPRRLTSTSSSHAEIP